MNQNNLFNTMFRKARKLALAAIAVSTLMPVTASNPKGKDGPSDPPCKCGDDASEENESYFFTFTVGGVNVRRPQSFAEVSRVGAFRGNTGTIGVQSFKQTYDSLYTDSPLNRRTVFLQMDIARLGPMLDPRSLFIDSSGDFITRYSTEGGPDDGGYLRQVVTDTHITDIEEFEDELGFEIKRWRRNGAALTGDPDPPHLIHTPGQILGIQPDLSVKFRKAPSSVGGYLVTYTERYGARGTHQVTNHIVQRGEDHRTIDTYIGNNIGILIRRQVNTYSERGEKDWDYTLLKEVYEAPVNKDGEYGEVVLVSRDRKIYRDYSRTSEGGEPGGRRLIEEIKDYGGEDLVTTHTYGEATRHISIDTQYGRPLRTIYPDGSWIVREYVDSPTNRAPVHTVYKSWNDVPIEQYRRGLKEETQIRGQEFTTTTSVRGVVLSESTTTRKVEEETGLEIITESVKTGSGNSVTVTGYNRQNAPDAQDQTLSGGRPSWIEYPDGTASVFSYSGDIESLVITEDKGAGNRDGIVRGVRTVTTHNMHLVVIQQEVYGLEDTELLISSKVADLNYSIDQLANDFPKDIVRTDDSNIRGGLNGDGTPIKWIYNDNDQDYSINARGCCGLKYTRNRQGALMYNKRDALRRVYHRFDFGSKEDTPIETFTEFNGLTTKVTRKSGSETLFVSERERSLDGLTSVSKSPDANGDGQLETTTRVTTYQTGGGKVTTTTRPDGSTAITTTFLDGRTKSTTGNGVYAMTYNYGTHQLNGGSGKYTTVTKGNGTESYTIFYDLLGRSILTKYADESSETTTYYGEAASAGARHKLESTTDADGVSTFYSYNAEGETISNTTDLPKDKDGNVQFLITEMNQDVVHNSVSGIGNAYRTTTTVNGVLTSTSFRSTDGYRSKSITLSGTSTSERTIGIDGAWTITSISNDGTRTVQNYVNSLLEKSEYRNHGHGSRVAYTYDSFDRMKTSTDGRGLTTTIDTYLDNGSVTQMTDSAGFVTKNTYDTMGRTIIVDAPDTLDADGNTLGNITYTAYYLTGQTKAQWGSQTYPKIYEYDQVGRMRKLHTYQADPNIGSDPLTVSLDSFTIPANSAVTTWTYSSDRGFMTRKEYDDGKGTDYTYTAAGRLATRTWARGVTTTYTYQEGYLTLTDYSDSTPDIACEYDNFGRKTEVTRGGTLHASYSYDPANFTLTEEALNQDGLARTLTRSYDSLLRSTGYTLEGSDGVSPSIEAQSAYTYDSLGRLGSVTDGTNVIATYAYLANAPSLLETITLPTHKVVNTYEATRNILDTKANQYSDGSIISSFDYTVNAIGQRTDVNRTGAAFAASSPITWGYDALGQVTKANYSDLTQDEEYSYDQIGNRSTKSLAGNTTSYVSNDLNQMTAVGSDAQTFDEDGNLQQSADGLALTWDAENRMTSSTKAGVVTTYQYDYLSRRISKETNGVTSTFLYDGWNVIAEYVDTSLDKVYTWGMDLSGSMQGAGGVGGLLAVTNASNETSYPTYDGNGNVSEYMEANNVIAAHYEYDAFGNEITSKTTGAKSEDYKYKFSTKPQDSETNYYYYGYRYYNPVTGTWPNRDPIQERGGTNLYGFVDNDGVNGWDYLGLKLFKAWQRLNACKSIPSIAKRCVKQIKKTNLEVCKQTLEFIENNVDTLQDEYHKLAKSYIDECADEVTDFSKNNFSLKVTMCAERKAFEYLNEKYKDDVDAISNCTCPSCIALGLALNKCLSRNPAA